MLRSLAGLIGVANACSSQATVIAVHEVTSRLRDCYDHNQIRSTCASLCSSLRRRLSAIAHLAAAARHRPAARKCSATAAAMP
jgi:hypothetical protein